MTKLAGSFPKGRRTRDEVPDVPASAALTELQRSAQSVLIGLVEDTGGRYGNGSPIGVGGIDVLADLFHAWGRAHSERRAGQLYFNGHPGLWHALDELYPLQDPNRWDRLRSAVITELETRGWKRTAPPRGVAFHVPD